VRLARRRLAITSIAGANANTSVPPHHCAGAPQFGRGAPRQFTLHDAFNEGERCERHAVRCVATTRLIISSSPRLPWYDVSDASFDASDHRITRTDRLFE
jgi:hypothetical protein